MTEMDLRNVSEERTETPAPPRKRNVVLGRAKADTPVATVETIRNRLGMTKAEFSLALGFVTDGGYAQSLRRGGFTKTVALAAEALMRRQARQGDVVYLTRVIKGVPDVTMLEDCKRLTLDGMSYLLVPDAGGGR